MFDVLINYLRYPANHRFGFLVRRPRVFHKDRYHIAVPTGKQYEANIVYADVLPALVPGSPVPVLCPSTASVPCKG